MVVLRAKSIDLLWHCAIVVTTILPWQYQTNDTQNEPDSDILATTLPETFSMEYSPLEITKKESQYHLPSFSSQSPNSPHPRNLKAARHSLSIATCQTTCFYPPAPDAETSRLSVLISCFLRPRFTETVPNIVHRYPRIRHRHSLSCVGSFM